MDLDQIDDILLLLASREEQLGAVFQQANQGMNMLRSY
jgi:hypothetical protein